jgi:hypothetical protein
MCTVLRRYPSSHATRTASNPEKNMIHIDIGRKVTSDIGPILKPTNVKQNNKIEQIKASNPKTAVALAIKSKKPKCSLRIFL